MESVRAENDLRDLIASLREKELQAWDKGDSKSLWRIAFLLRAANHAFQLELKEQVQTLG